MQLPSEEAERCRLFARLSSKTQREHRSGGTKERGLGEIFGDTFRGKIGECASKRFLEQTPLNVPGIELDFRIYPRGKWDEYDFIVYGKRFSIKSVKHFSSWLLLESKDIERGDVYDYYLLAAVNRREDGAMILGFASKEEVLEGPNTVKLKKGDLIPGTGTVLDADNHAIHKSHLINSEEGWIQLIENLIKEL